MKQYSLGKEERLKSRKLTETVFSSGRSINVFPVKVIYSFTDQPQWKFPVQAGVSAPGKIFKRSVERNRVKRLLREAYRLQKTELYDTCRQHQKQLAVFFIYLDKEIPEFEKLKPIMNSVLSKLSTIVSASSNKQV